MSHDPFEGQMLLTYALKDAPGEEWEEWVDDLADARRYLRAKTIPHMVEWAYLFDQHGQEIADIQVLL